MKNNKIEAVEAYVAEVAKLVKTGKTTEHSFRGVLATLLNALAPGLQAVNEPKRSACGAPDYIVQNKAGASVFFVEAKDLGDGDLDGRKRTGHKEQFDRYKAALDPIIFTDYLDFHLYRHHQLIGSVRIADCDGDKVVGCKGQYEVFVNMIAEAASANPQNINSAKQLAEMMAGKARMIQNTAEAYLKPLVEAWNREAAGRHTPSVKAPLLSMLLDFRTMLIPEVGAEEFSDIFAQTLTYGMFAARLNDKTPENFSRTEAMALIPKSNPFLKQVFTYIATNLEDELEWAVDDLAELFANADVAHIMKDYGKAVGMADPMVHFYEDFLKEYDAGLRKDRGVWYTPVQVVRFIVGATDWALRKFFSLPDGLADSSKTEIVVEEATASGKKLAHKVKKQVHRVQILDPAMGTGTFHAEVVRNVHRLFAGKEGMWPGYVEQDLLPRLNGFELMMASYTMAHVKLDYVLRETGATPTGKERFRLFLTDSLSDWHKELPGGLFAAALGAEQQGADEVKRDIPVMVVVGNPPYSGESQNKGVWIMRLMEAYKVEPGGKMRLKERNPKWLNNDYVKFIRLAEHYVERNGSGIVAYITPHGFLSDPTFRGMRWHLMQTFDEIYTLNLHGDTKKKEVAPDGGKDECVFKIQQGVAITLMVKKPGKTKAPCRIHYADLWGKRAAKLSALDSATMESVKWKEVKPTAPMLFFVPRDTSAEAEWLAGFGIAELMPINGVGITTKRDNIAIQDTEESLRIVLQDYCTLSESNLKSKYGILTESKETLVSRAIENVKACGIGSHEQRIFYRPFDLRWTYFTDWVRGFLSRPVFKLMRHFIQPNAGLIVGRQGQVIGNADWNLVFCTENIVDLNAFYRGGGCTFPLYLYEDHLGTVEKRPNMDKSIVAKIAAAIGGPAPMPEAIFNYIYGVLHSPAYRAKFKEFLKSDFPRIPYPKSRDQFEAVAEIGEELVAVHLMRDAAPGLSETRANFPKPGSNAVEQAVRDPEGRVWINADQFFSNVPERAWQMPIGGYQPAQKWLKDRKGRALTLDDLKHYQRIIVALEKTADAMEKLQLVES